MAGWSAHQADESLPRKLVGRLKDLARVHALLRTWSPDAIYVASSHNWTALLRDVPLAASISPGKPPVVLHFHGSECDKLGRRGHGLFTVASHWLARRVSAVLLLSTEEVQKWRRHCPGVRLELVANPYSPPTSINAPTPRSHRADSPSDPLTILFVGRLVREKGVFELLDAFRMVREGRDCRLRIAGVGPAEGDLVRRAASLGLLQHIQFLGYVSGDDLDNAYRSADVFVLPSYREGFPLVVMEAMGYGLPIVTTPIRGCADHLAPGVHALYASPRDPVQLAGRLLELLDDDGLRRRMGQANLVKAADFAPEAVVPRYAEILRSVAESR